MAPIATCPGLSFTISTNGTSIDASTAATLGETSTAPTPVPKTVAATVRPSIQPFATTSWDEGKSSVMIPYFAGEYAAAPTPTSAYAANGSNPKSIKKHPTILSPLHKNMTRPFGSESAKAPTSGASTTYAAAKQSFKR